MARGQDKLFWLALLVLVGNDHALKHAGLAPGWLTGKLSDFAGLIVAPVVLAALVGARSPRARLACITSVALVFASFELFPAWARAVEALSGHRVRMWPDLTDLVALSILPVTLWVMTPKRALGPLRLGSPLVHRAGIALASFACIATSGPGYAPVLSPIVFNGTRAPIAVTARRYVQRVWCSGEDGGIGMPRLSDDTPVLSDFGQQLTETIEPGEFMQLGALGGPVYECTAYWVSAASLGELIVLAEQVPDAAREQDANALVLEGPIGELRAHTTLGVWISTIPAPASGAQ